MSNGIISGRSNDPADHFAGTGKMIEPGTGGVS